MATLDKEMIRDPHLWQLIMEIGRDSMQVMAFSLLEHHAMISADIPLDKSIDSLKAFQDAVYANPLLLGDFRKVTVLLPTRRFLVAPDIVGTPEQADAIFNRAHSPSAVSEAEEIIAEELPGMSARMLMGVPAELAGYLRRTFNNPRISHTLTPQALYFKAKHPTRPHGKMLVNLHRDRCDVVILGYGAPLLLNSYEIREPLDAVYYIMACRQAISLTDTDEIIIAGDPETRTAVAAILRRYVRYVIPAIFPSVMFRAGRAALRTPFEMVVCPLAWPDATAATTLSKSES